MRKLMLLVLVGIVVLGLERLFARGQKPSAASAPSAQNLTYIPASDWDRFKELFH
jgi:hypothetical protein